MLVIGAVGLVHYPKNGFLEGRMSIIFGKVCKWMG
jgi:hypothetical protein